MVNLSYSQSFTSRLRALPEAGSLGWPSGAVLPARTHLSLPRRSQSDALFPGNPGIRSRKSAHARRCGAGAEINDSNRYRRLDLIGQRSGAFDLSKAVRMIPAERMKPAKELRVPLFHELPRYWNFPDRRVATGCFPVQTAAILPVRPRRCSYGGKHRLWR